VIKGKKQKRGNPARRGQEDSAKGGRRKKSQSHDSPSGRPGRGSDPGSQEGNCEKGEKYTGGEEGGGVH